MIDTTFRSLSLSIYIYRERERDTQCNIYIYIYIHTYVYCMHIYSTHINTYIYIYIYILYTYKIEVPRGPQDLPQRQQDPGGAGRRPTQTTQNRVYTRSPLEDSRLFGPSPWKILRHYLWTNGFLAAANANVVITASCEIQITASSSLRISCTWWVRPVSSLKTFALQIPGSRFRKTIVRNRV